MISIKVSLCVGLILLPLLLTAADSNEIEIIANGGIVKWIDKNSLSYKTNQVTGGLELDSQGNPAIIYHTYASFTGTSTFQFPNDSNITFLAEVDDKTTFAYWIVDGEIKMGENRLTKKELPLSIELSRRATEFIDLPKPSITIDSSISRIEAVFVSKPSETSALPSPISHADSTDKEIEIVSHGGIVSWVDKNSVRMERDHTTGGPILNSRGELAVEFHTYASFTGSSTLQFPNDSNITFLAELDDNTTLAYWIVDRVIKLGKHGGGENLGGILTLNQPHITIDSSISKIEAVFIPKPKLTSPYLQQNEKSDDHLIISNGGVIQWISPEPNPTFEIDPFWGGPVLDKYGNPKVLRTILGYFTGSQNFSFPSNINLNFYPEPLLNHEFGYWLIDGEINLGKSSNSLNHETIPDFPDNSIKIGNRFKVIEAVYFPVPLNSSRYKDDSKLIYSEEDVREKVIESLENFPFIDRKGWLDGYNEGWRGASERLDGSDYVLGVKNGEDSVKLDPTSYNLVSKAYHEEILYELNTRIKNISSNNTTHYTEGWFYLPNRGWMWTKRSAYPYFYDAEDKEWMYFQSGEEKPRFYRYKTKTWLTIE